MPITTPVSEQHRELEGITNAERSEVYGSGSAKWASASPDCLSLIFEAGLGCVLPWDEFNEVATDDRDLCKYLLTITRICRRWRQVALDTPRLWNILIFNEQASLSKLQTWLDRSKAAPLHIYLLQGYQVPSVSIDNELIPLLLQHINHWGSFNYRSHTYLGLATLLEALEGEEVPLLEKLSLSGGTWHRREFESQIAPQPFNGTLSAPKLVDVKLWSIPLDWSNSPFRNLRALSLAWHSRQNVEAVKLEQFLALLQESPQLMKLELALSPLRSDELTTVFNRSGQTPKPVSLPSLTILRIRRHRAPDILTLTLRLIHAPNLEELQLSHLEWDEEGSHGADFSSTIEALGNGVLSSFERLETLSLNRVAFRSKAAWYLFCSKLTHVRDMTLGFMYYGPKDPEEPEGGDAYNCLLSAFLPHEDQSDLAPASDATAAVWKVRCPNLQKLSASGCWRGTMENLTRQRSEVGYGIAQVIF